MGAMETRSTTLGSHAEGENERRRALIMGGWSEDNVAANTLESAKVTVAQLQLDIEAFVPQMRRGYVIVPYSARTGETESQCQERLRGAMARVRQANILIKEEGSQGPRRLWLNFSTLPDRRKRAILAGKIKRAVLEETATTNGGNRRSIATTSGRGMGPGRPWTMVPDSRFAC